MLVFVWVYFNGPNGVLEDVCSATGETDGIVSDEEICVSVHALLTGAPVNNALRSALSPLLRGRSRDALRDMRPGDVIAVAAAPSSEIRQRKTLSYEVCESWFQLIETSAA